MIRSRSQVKSAERMAKKSISNAHFLVFLSRQCQNVGNVHETFINTKIPFKRRTFLDHRVEKVPHVSSETSLRRLVQNKPSALIPAKKTRLNSSKHNFMVKSSRLLTKKNLSIFLNFFFPFVSFIGVFSNLKRETLVLKTTTWWTRANHFFVDGWHPLRCQIRFFPIPYVVDHLTFLGEGRMGDLVWVRMFLPNLWS